MTRPAELAVACLVCDANPGEACRTVGTRRVTDTHAARLAAYQPRRVRPADEFEVLDDHQRLLVAIEQQAADWMSDAHILQERGATIHTVSSYRAHAEKLRTIARAHAKRRRR